MELNTNTITFIQLLQYRRHPEALPSRLLALDPGETTGWAAFNDGAYKQSGHINTTEQPMTSLRTLLRLVRPTVIVAENYVVYSHKLKSHTNNRLITARVLGMIQGLCEEAEIPLHLQMASQAKGFVPDTRLRNWGLWQPGERHARDAIRHGVYYLVFGPCKKGK